MLRYRTWNFDIDRYIQPIVSAPPWPHLPYPVARFFGYRKTKPVDTGNLMPIFWAFVGVFCSILVLEAAVTNVPAFQGHKGPLIVGSFVGSLSLLPLFGFLVSVPCLV